MTGHIDRAPVQGSETFRIRPDDPDYARDLAAEGAFWDQPHFFTLDDPVPEIRRYENERLTGDPNLTWYEAIARYGTFRRGCIVGAGWISHEAGLLQTNPDLHLTFLDISADSLAKRERELGERFPGRVAVIQQDLNFAELPAGAFDLVVSCGCLHHITNIEHIAQQISRSLAPDGWFFLMDYVGESRFQFDGTKKRLFEAAFAQAQQRRPELRSWHVVWPDPDLVNVGPMSPWEAVRSDDTLDVLRRHFEEVLVREVGALLSMLVFLRPEGGLQPPKKQGPLARLLRMPPSPNYRRIVSLVARELIPADRLVSDAGIVKPWNAFAVYRKKKIGAPA